MRFSKYKDYYSSIIKIGVPIVIGQLGMVFVGFADNIMVGRFSTDDLAAASFVNSAFNIPIFIGLGFAYGLTPLVGRAFGVKNFSLVSRLLKNSILMNFIVGILLSLCMGAMLINLDKMGQPEELLGLIRSYFILQLISLPFLMMFNSFKQFSEGITNSKTPMYIMLVANVLNVIGNYFLIYGVGDIPPLGIVGAGISTLCSRIFTLLMFVWIFFFSKQYSEFREDFDKEKLNMPDILKLNKMGWFIGIQLGMETALFSLTGMMVGWLGKIPLASHQVLVSISTLGFMVYYGVGSAVSVLVSNRYGVSDFIGLRRFATAGFHLVLVLCTIFVSVLLISRNSIGFLFTDDVQIIQMVSTLIYLMALYQFGDGIQIIYANALRGMGDVYVMALISFIGYFIIALPISYTCAFVLEWGLIGIWIGYPIGLTLAGTFLRLRFASITRKNILNKRKERLSRIKDNYPIDPVVS